MTSSLPLFFPHSWPGFVVKVQLAEQSHKCRPIFSSFWLASSISSSENLSWAGSEALVQTYGKLTPRPRPSMALNLDHLALSINRCWRWFPARLLRGRFNYGPLRDGGRRPPPTRSITISVSGIIAMNKGGIPFTYGGMRSVAFPYTFWERNCLWSHLVNGWGAGQLPFSFPHRLWIYALTRLTSAASACAKEAR